MMDIKPDSVGLREAPTPISVPNMIIIGFVAGVIARFLHPGNKYEPKGFILTTVLGIVGAARDPTGWAPVMPAGKRPGPRGFVGGQKSWLRGRNGFELLCPVDHHPNFVFAKRKWKLG